MIAIRERKTQIGADLEVWRASYPQRDQGPCIDAFLETALTACIDMLGREQAFRPVVTTFRG